MDRKIEKDSRVPMYEQIAARLKNEILEKKFGSSGNVGTHTQLAEEFGVSLITVRKAVQLLVDEGLLDVVQGKGTFVKNTVLQDDLTRLTGASNIISESHLSAKVDVAAFEIIDTPSSFGPELKEGLGKQCLHIQRVHLLEKARTAYAEIYIPGKYGANFTKADVESRTIYQLYEEKLHMQLGRGKQTIRADRASPRRPRLCRSPKAGRCSPSAAGPTTPRRNWWNT